jgi:integrase
MVRHMLTDTAIYRAKRRPQRYKLADRDGLYLAVLPTGKKVFRYEYRFHQKRETLTLGTYSSTGHGMSLIEARAEHAKARRMLEQGNSPAQARRKENDVAAFKQGTSFRGVAEQWMTEFSPHRSAAWSKLAKRFLNEAYKVLGDKPIADVAQDHVLAACKKAQDRGSLYTANAIRRYIGAVFTYAASCGLSDRNPAVAARGALAVPATRKLPALSPKEIRDLVKLVRANGGRAGTRIALELLLLTFVRKRELIQATWSEIDFESAEWRIPAERMKAKELHIVPLSRQALDLFRQAKKLASGSKYVFPGLTSLVKPLSDTALNNALVRLGFSHFSPHGFRRTASTILNELGWLPDVIERQLAHQERNKIRAAYNKATYLEDRTKMMQAWADHVDAIVAGAKVVPIGKKVAG